MSTLSRRILVQRAVEIEITKSPKTVRKTNTGVRLEKITTENDVLNGAELCIEVFFVDDDENNNSVSSMIRRMNTKKLLRKHSYDLLNRFVRRPKDDCMVKAVQTNTGEMIGYAEIFVSQLDSSIYRDYVERSPAQQRLLEVDGKIFLPKIANLAGGLVAYPLSTYVLPTLSKSSHTPSQNIPAIVLKSARQQGIGKQLVRACLQQARAWGFEQVVLTVDVDNIEGRSFYKRLGFEEMITDMSEKRYDISAGPWLTTVRAPKVQHTHSFHPLKNSSEQATSLPPPPLQRLCSYRKWSP